MDAQLYLHSCSLLQHGELSSTVSFGKAPLKSFKCSFPNDILILRNLSDACIQQVCPLMTKYAIFWVQEQAVGIRSHEFSE